MKSFSTDTSRLGRISFLALALLVLIFIGRLGYVNHMSNKVMNSIYQFSDYEIFLQNIRGLKDNMAEDAYQEIDPDTFDNLRSYIRLSSSEMKYRVIHKNISLNGEVFITFHILTENVSPNRLFHLRMSIPLIKIKELNRWELLRL